MVLVIDQTPSPLMIDILNSIVNSGSQVSIYCGEIKSGRDKLHPSVNIIQGKIYQRKTMILRLYTWLVFSIQYFFYLAFCKKPSVILVITNPPFTTLITSFIASKRKIPFSLLIYDLYPEALLHAELGKGDSLVIRIWKKLNTRYFKRADRIFTISNTMKTGVSKYAPADKIQVIHNWADTDYIKPIIKEMNPFLKRLGLQNKQIVLYAGNCGLTHDLESLIDAADLLKDNDTIFFLVVGEGAKKQKLENMAKRLKLSNILFFPYQNETEFPLVMASADIGIITLGIAAETISVPSKTYSNLAAGACLVAVAHHDSELAEIIANYEVGVLCPPLQPRQLADIITRVLSNETLLNRYKSNSLKAVKDFTPANADEYAKYLKNF